MLNLRNTLIIFGVAVVLGVLGAIAAAPPAPPERPEGLGKPFFPDFNDVRDAAQLLVVTYNKDLGEAENFAVARKKNKWVIPSHENYPADAETRMGRAVSTFIDWKKGHVLSNRVKDHGKFGVIDPTAGPDLDAEGRGTRVTIRNEGNQRLCDVIVGKEVEGQTDHRYVRMADRKPIYKVKVSLDISTRFTDWIETDLLGIDAWKIDRMEVRDYSVDEHRGQVKMRGELLVTKDKDGEWKLSGPIKEDEELNQGTVDNMKSTLDDLRIVDVRKAPTWAGREHQYYALQEIGIYLYRDPKTGWDMPLGNEGELRAETEDGVEYRLFFGEIAGAAGGTGAARP